MTESRAIDALNALAQPTRLHVFRRLVACYPDELLAGEIARQCRTPHNTMSTHLAILARASLVTARKDGRTVNYAANVEGFQSLIGFLLQDCCRGRAEICAPLAAALTCCTPAPARKGKVHA